MKLSKHACQNTWWWNRKSFLTYFLFFQVWMLHKEEKTGLQSLLKILCLPPSECCCLAASSVWCSSSPLFSACCVGGKQKMGSWVLGWREIQCLSLETVMCSVAGAWKKQYVEDNIQYSCCMMGACTRVDLTAVDSWATINQGPPRVCFYFES